MSLDHFPSYPKPFWILNLSSKVSNAKPILVLSANLLTLQLLPSSNLLLGDIKQYQKDRPMGDPTQYRHWTIDGYSLNTITVFSFRLYFLSFMMSWMTVSKVFLNSMNIAFTDLLSIHRAHHFVREGNEVGKAWSAFDESLLTLPNHLLLLLVLRNTFVD